MAALAWILIKFPFLKGVWAFLKSGKFLTVLAIIVVSLFVATQTISFFKGLIDREVDQRTTIQMKKHEVKELENQVEVLQRNQDIVTKVVIETRQEQDAQKQKTEQIKDRINERIQKGDDGFSGPIITDTIDSL